MDYTEENFFGNKQNSAKEPEEKLNEKVDVGNTVFSTFMKTFAVLFGLLFYFLGVSVCVIPEKAIKFYEVFNADKTIIVCYEKIYQKSGELADLYNVVQKSIEAKRYEKTAKYIKKLQNSDGYDEFCSMVNSASVSATENKYIAYVADLDGYLVSQNILALYNLGKKQSAKDVAVKDIVYSENIYSFGISTYIECLMNDKSYSLEERKQMLIEFYEEVVDENQTMKSISSYIDDKRDLVDLSQAVGNDKVDKILRVYTSLKIENTRLLYYEAKEMNTDAVRLEIEELQERYAQLIG